jgi:JmjC domain
MPTTTGTTAPTTAAPTTTADLPGPLARCFGGDWAEHWQQAPLVGRDATGADFADLLDLESVDELITTRALRTPAFRMVRDADPVPRGRYTTTRRWGGSAYDGVVDPAAVAAEVADGATLVLQSLHTWWAPLGRFCADLHEALGHPVQANAYLTPPGERGLGLHYDTHDVVVLQTSGTKRWEVYEPRFEWPLGSQHWSDVAPPGEALEDVPTPMVLDVRLGPGDCLYLPRGFIHRATGEDASSLHVTVGIHVQTWHHVLRDLVDQAALDPELRRVVDGDPSVLERQLKDLLAEVDLDERIASLGRSAFLQYADRHRGLLSEVVAPRPIADDLVVERLPGPAVALTVEDGRCVLRLPDRVVRLPERARPALEQVLGARGAFAVGDLSSHLDAPSREVVVRRLLREGLLRRHDGG